MKIKICLTECGAYLLRDIFCNHLLILLSFKIEFVLQVTIQLPNNKSIISKMKNYLIYILIFLSSNLDAQSLFPEGVYLNPKQLRAHQPAFKSNLTIEADSSLSGFIRYQLHSQTDSIDNKFIMKKIFAYIHHDSIYINSMNFVKYNYVKALTKGNFIVFLGPPDGNGVGNGITIYQQRTAMSPPILKIFSLRTGTINNLSIRYLKLVLKEFPDLLSQFKKEKNKITKMMDYIHLVNERIPVISYTGKN